MGHWVIGVQLVGSIVEYCALRSIYETIFSARFIHHSTTMQSCGKKVFEIKNEVRQKSLNRLIFDLGLFY